MRVKSLCPQCPVYTACQERGYLSQPSHITTMPRHNYLGLEQTFFGPTRIGSVRKNSLNPLNGTQRLCIVSSMQIGRDYFWDCSISSERLEEWRVNWQGHALGNFAETLMNTLEIESEPDDFVVRRIRRNSTGISAT